MVILDAYDLLDTSFNIIELNDLPGIVDSIVEDLNNSVTRLLGMSPAEAIKKKNAFAKPSKPRKGPIRFDEKRLFFDDSVIYLLDPSEYEGGRRRATDMNWSSKIYNICESLVNILVTIYLELDLSVGVLAVDLIGVLNIGRLEHVFLAGLRDRAFGGTVQELGNQIAQENLFHSLTYEQLINRYHNRLTKLNISLCRECFIPIGKEEGEYCNECVPL
ncbi:hypothetical protein GLOIN_2v1878227 [Rhizophagus clarus]|uniref:Uncharacterized protein n=1 Tax=Rhizophagus clarus TaxID=94130 RepID=A0A8H3MBJ4_9GLOM|nr:hypothetical protein GLOIN_2v1878227 [Rhizophagus clarus]